MLEEQYRLALAQRFAPKSEKCRDRAFNEAEQLAATEPADEDNELSELPDTGLPQTGQPESRSTIASYCPAATRVPR